MTITTAVFDLGGVVVHWNPRAAFAGLLTDAEIDEFFAAIDFPTWNRAQDAGRPWAQAHEQIVREHPRYAHLAGVLRANFQRAVSQEVGGTAEILRELRAAGIRLLVITNFSAETFAETYERFEIFSVFEGFVVSGAERVLKPDHTIYRLLFERYGIDPAEAVFVDDTPANVVAARDVGMRAIHFTGAAGLRAELAALGLPVAPAQPS